MWHPNYDRVHFIHSCTPLLPSIASHINFVTKTTGLPTARKKPCFLNLNTWRSLYISRQDSDTVVTSTIITLCHSALSADENWDGFDTLHRNILNRVYFNCGFGHLNSILLFNNIFIKPKGLLFRNVFILYPSLLKNKQKFPMMTLAAFRVPPRWQQIK